MRQPRDIGPLFTAVAGPATLEMPRTGRSSRMAIWGAAAASLVVGVVIGFASGYTAGQRGTLSGSAIGILGTSTPDPAAEPVTTSGRAYTEGELGSDRSDLEGSDRSASDVSPDEAAVSNVASRSAEEAANPPNVSNVNRPNTSDPNVPSARNANGPNVADVVRPNRNVPNQNDSNVPNGPNDSNGPNGSIEVLSRPAGAEVILDGRVVGRTPLSIPNVLPGAHSIRLELPGFNRWATSVDITAGARTRVAASLEQP